MLGFLANTQGHTWFHIIFEETDNWVGGLKGLRCISCCVLNADKQDMAPEGLSLLSLYDRAVNGTSLEPLDLGHRPPACRVPTWPQCLLFPGWPGPSAPAQSTSSWTLPGPSQSLGVQPGSGPTARYTAVQRAAEGTTRERQNKGEVRYHSQDSKEK